MSGRADDGRDYDVFKVKVKKRDKDGNDITSNKAGSGGRRREDGTLSSMYYDPELFDESEDTPDREMVEAQLLECALEDQRIKQERTQEMIELVFYGLDRLSEFLADHPEIVLKIKDGVCSIGHSMADGFQSIKAKLTLKKSVAQKKLGSVVKGKPVQVEGELLLTSTEYPRQGKTVIMTVEEARLEVLNVLSHYIEMKKGLQRLSDANVIEMQKLGFEGAIVQLENIVKQYPALMDERIEVSILDLALDAKERERVKLTLLPL